jgi:hypothetical protein
MYKIEQKYRSSYTGEDVTTRMTLQGQVQQYEKEWVPNNVFNNHITTQAIVLGGGWLREQFDMSLIKNHKGGLLGSSKLQTYGCNDVYKDIECDFLVTIGRENAAEIASNGYCDNHIVYSNAGQVLDYPGKFYLIPQDPSWNAGAIAAYLAAFDGHDKIFLLGCEMDDNHPFWAKAMRIVFDTYPDVDFVLVQGFSADGYVPNEWKDVLNFRTISTREFVVEADLG